MPDYRRYFVPGGTYFFTLVTLRRFPVFQSAKARIILGHVLRRCQKEWPFDINAVVLLPDHLHTIWTLPSGDSRYSARWSRIKRDFTRQWLAIGGTEQAICRAAKREHRRGVWQPRFWEHLVRDENDFELRFDYIHFNPVKHGLVMCPKDWPHSSFRRWVAARHYEENWACGTEAKKPEFKSIDRLCGEPGSNPE